MMVEDERERIVGLIPAAEDPADASIVVSHPGITYGGLVHDRSLRGEQVISALSEVINGFAELGYELFRYKAVPWIYHRRPSADDLYALFRLGARRSDCKISAVLDLDVPARPSAGRRYWAKRAAKAGVEVQIGWESICAFWQVLEANLAARYQAAPTHSLSEIEELHRRFPDEIELIVGKLDGEVVSGAVLFAAGAVLHLQYSASSDLGLSASALDPVLIRAFDFARERERRFFCFGTSNEDDGWGLNQSLYEFKLSFGAGSVAQEQYELSLHEVDLRRGM